MPTPGGPLSVVLPDDLRERLVAEAERRGLKLSTVVRTLVAERIREIDEAEELTKALEWQRAQAWGSWEALRAGAIEEAPAGSIDAAFEGAIERSKRRKK